MNLFIYSDESGVFDKAHYRYFCFGGLICLNTEGRDLWSRKYAAAEKSINNGNKYGDNELKASRISAKDKSKLFRSLNHCYKFGIVIDMYQLLDEIFESKKDKQRYLDYVYKTVTEEAIIELANQGVLKLDDIQKVFFNVDEHSTATNGVYELQAILEQELLLGTFNYDYSTYYPPTLSHCDEIQVTFCNSATKVLIRAADIIANKVNYCATNDKLDGLKFTNNLFMLKMPLEK